MINYMPNRVKAETELREFYKDYPLVIKKKDSVIVRSGDIPEEVYFIVKGKVKELDISHNDSEVTINVFTKPTFLSILWVFGVTNSRFTYVAATDLRIHVVPLADIRKFMLNNPDVMYTTLQRIVRGLDGFMLRMANQMRGTAEKKVAIELVIEANRFHKMLNNNVKLDSNVNELTSLTGLARETVSRQITNLTNKGLISKQKNRITIVDLAKLEEFVAAQ